MDDRVQKILSQWGVASRRQAEQMILAGRVRLNGAVVQLGQKADPEQDQIEVDGVPLRSGDRPQPVYLLLNKPAGVVSTCTDPWGRRTVLDLLTPDDLQGGLGIHPVGRLDVASTGALLLTNDGNLTFCLTHPRYHIPKTYQVWVEGYPSESILQQWRQGVMLSDRRTLPAQVDLLECHLDHQTLLQIVLKEGRNRQIRRVAEQLGHPVIDLHRTAIGPIQLNPLNPPEMPFLPAGCYRPLKDFEIGFLKAQIDLTSVRMPVRRKTANE
ncbi:MAG: pseudouridine synthase [Kovacikia sp.]